MDYPTSIIRFKFDDFERKTQKLDYIVMSDYKEVLLCSNVFDADRGDWQLQLYSGLCDSGEGGGGESEDDEDWMSFTLFFERLRVPGFRASTLIIIRDSVGKTFEECILPSFFYTHDEAIESKKVVTRSIILDEGNKVLVNGALIVDVVIQAHLDSGSFHVAQSVCSSDMLQYFENGRNADITFDVEGALIPAHSLILDARAPAIFDLCQGQKKGAPLMINNCKRNIFVMILRYAYGGEIPRREVLVNEGREIIKASNYFGIIGLKHAAECALVQCRVINDKNLVDYIRFAHENTCPLLKEYAFAYFTTRGNDVLQSGAWEELYKCPVLTTEVFQFVLNNGNRSETRALI